MARTVRLELLLVLGGVFVASHAVAQGIGFSFGNRYQVSLLNSQDCPVELLEETYVKKPDYPVGYRDVDQNMLGYKLLQKIELKVFWKNRASKPIASADVQVSAFDAQKVLLGSPIAKVAEYRPLKPGKSTFQVMYSPAIANVDHVEVRVLAVRFSDGTRWAGTDVAPDSSTLGVAGQGKGTEERLPPLE